MTPFVAIADLVPVEEGVWALPSLDLTVIRSGRIVITIDADVEVGAASIQAVVVR